MTFPNEFQLHQHNQAVPVSAGQPPVLRRNVSRSTATGLVFLGLSMLVGAFGLYLFLARIDVVGFLTEDARLFSYFHIFLMLAASMFATIGTVFAFVGAFRSKKKVIGIGAPLGLLGLSVLVHFGALNIGVGELQARTLSATERYAGSELADQVNELEFDLSRLGPVRGILDALKISYPGKTLVDGLDLTVPIK